MNARRFNERFDAAVRARALDIESLLRLVELDARLHERSPSPSPEPTPERGAREAMP